MGNFTSIYKALIHDLNDPEKRGRAKLLVPAVLGRNVSGWAAAIFDVDDPLTLPPKVGEQVWVFFENGDLNRPTWIRAQVTTTFPTGAGLEWYTNTAPTGWLLQDNGEYPIADYLDLYNVLTTNGTVFPHGANTNGSGAAGTTHFRTPMRKGRIGVGRDPAQTEFDTLGEVGGAKTHTLTTAEMPSHTHVQNSHNHTQNSHNHTQDSHNHGQTGGQSANHYHLAGSLTTPHGMRSEMQYLFDNHNQYTGLGGWGAISGWSNNWSNTVGGNTNWASGDHTHTVSGATATNQATTATNQATTATNQNTGGDGAHNNMPPYTVVNYIIKT